MARKPKPVEPPPSLSDDSQALWRTIVPERARSAERQALVAEALHVRDRLEQVRAQMNSEELLSETETTKAKHVNPLLGIERDLSKLFLKFWDGMNLDWDRN